MVKIRRIFILGLMTLGLTPALSHAQQTCENVFANSARFSAAKAYRSWRLQRHDKDLQAALLGGPRSVKLWVEEKYRIARVQKSLLDRQAPHAKTRPLEKLSKIQIEKLATEGLLTLLPSDKNLRQKLRSALVKMQDSTLGNFAQFPFLGRALAPDVLPATLEKWLLEGYEAHQHNINLYLRQYANYEKYHHVRSAWNKMVMAAMAFYVWDEIQNFDTKALEKQIDQARSEKATQELLSTLPDATKIVQAYAEASFQNMLAAFVKKYGESPTAEEYAELQEIAYRDYGLKPPTPH